MIWLRRLAVAVAVVAIVTAAPAEADDLDDELAEVEAQIDDLVGDIDAASSERTDVVRRMQAIQGTISELRVELAVAEQALEDSTWQLNLERVNLDHAREQLADAYLQLADARDELAAGKESAEAAVLQLYMGSGQDTPGVVLTSQSLTSATLRLDYLERVSAHTGGAVVKLQGLESVATVHQEMVLAREAAIDEQVQVLDFIEEQRASYAEIVAAQTALVAEQLDQQRALLAGVDADLAFFEGELASLESQQSELEALIAAETDPGGDVAISAGGYVRPVPGAITSVFGPRLHPILGYTRMHSGVDMTAPYGQTIRAMEAGRVILAGPYGGYGNTVVIDHGGGMTTLYAHQSSLNVSYGDTVQAGDIVGAAGASGLATGPHLHFEVRVGGQAVDPAPYLAGT